MKFPQATIIGSGDLMDAETVVERLKTSGLDGVIIARGAIGNPWIFREARALYGRQDQNRIGPSLTEQGEVYLRHYELIAEMRPMSKSVRYFRKFAVGYSKHHPERKKSSGGSNSRKDQRRTLRCCQGMVRRRLMPEL